MACGDGQRAAELKQRKHAILFAATLLCARKFLPLMETDHPDPSQVLAVIFYAVREAFIELSRVMTTNVPWVESVLVIAAFMFVGILAILALGLILANCKE